MHAVANMRDRAIVFFHLFFHVIYLAALTICNFRIYLHVEHGTEISVENLHACMHDRI